MWLRRYGLGGAIFLAVVGLVFLGCTSDDTPTSPGGGTPLPDPSFAQDIQPIFNNNNCTMSQCHGQAQTLGLDLRPDSSYGKLVNVPAVSESFLRVKPGSADSSYLVIKLEGRQSVGTQMPAIGGPLNPVLLQNIKNWINQGAKNN